MADWMDELERLAELRDKGLITEDEYEAERAKIVPSAKEPANQTSSLPKVSTENLSSDSINEAWKSLRDKVPTNVRLHLYETAVTKFDGRELTVRCNNDKTFDFITKSIGTLQNELSTALNAEIQIITEFGGKTNRALSQSTTELFSDDQTFEEIKNNWFTVRSIVFPQTLRLSAQQSKLLKYENGTLFIQAHNPKAALEFEKLKRQISYEISERINLKINIVISSAEGSNPPVETSERTASSVVDAPIRNTGETGKKRIHNQKEISKGSKWKWIAFFIGFIIPAGFDRPITFYDHLFSGLLALGIAFVISGILRFIRN